MPDLQAAIAQFGADASSLRLLDEDAPELLPYATLTAARRGGDATLSLVEAVYEWQGAPLAFLVDADSLENEDQLRRIRRLLAMRGDAPYLAVVAPGSLTVYRVALDKKTLRQARVDWQDQNVAPSAVFAQLGNMRPNVAITNRNWISNVVLRLLTGSTRELIKLDVPHEDALSLVGRALFTRFLADRSLQDLSGPLRASAAEDWHRARGGVPKDDMRGDPSANEDELEQHTAGREAPDHDPLCQTGRPDSQECG